MSPVAERTTSTVTIDRELWKRAKVAAAQSEMTLAEVIERAVEEWLKGQKKN